METIVDFYVELVNFTESNIVRIDAQLFNMFELYVTTMYYLVAFLIVAVSVQAYINYKLRKSCDSLQEQIYSAHRKFDHKLTLIDS